MTYTPTTWVDGSAGNTAITAARLNNMEAGIAIQNTFGRWVSTSTATITAETGISSWTVSGNTPSGVSVSGDTFTVANAGRYAFNAQMFANAVGTNQTGEVGFSFKDPAGTLLYAYQMDFYNTAITAAVLLNCSAFPITLAAGATFKVMAYCTNPSGMTMAGTTTNLGTAFGIQRIG